MSNVKNTAPLILKDKEGNVVGRLKRKFLGNLFPKTGIEQAELRAYLKGHVRFSYKSFDEFGNRTYPYTVRQEYYYA